MRLDIKHKKEAMKLTQEKRQEFLNYMHDGLTIEEGYINAGLTFDQANGIILINIIKNTYHTLNKKTV